MPAALQVAQVLPTPDRITILTAPKPSAASARSAAPSPAGCTAITPVSCPTCPGRGAPLLSRCGQGASAAAAPAVLARCSPSACLRWRRHERAGRRAWAASSAISASPSAGSLAHASPCRQAATRSCGWCVRPSCRPSPRRGWWRGSNQGKPQNAKSSYYQSSIDFRCYLEMALFEPRPPLTTSSCNRIIAMSASMNVTLLPLRGSV